MFLLLGFLGAAVYVLAGSVCICYLGAPCACGGLAGYCCCCCFQLNRACCFFLCGDECVALELLAVCVCGWRADMPACLAVSVCLW